MEKHLKLLSKLSSVRILCVLLLLQQFFLDKSKTDLSLFVHTLQHYAESVETLYWLN